MTGIGFFDLGARKLRLRRYCSVLVPFWTTAGKEQRADELLANCSKKVIYEQSTARTVREQQEKRSRGWSCQPLKIEQLRRPPR